MRPTRNTMVDEYPLGIGYGADYLLLNLYYKQQFNKWWFLGSIFWLLTLTLYKLSVILLLKRIFVQRVFQIACWCMIVLTSCWGHLEGTVVFHRLIRSVEQSR